MKNKAVKQECIDNSDCGPGQCCNNYHGPLVASRRKRDAGSLLATAILPQKGVCENYQNEGDHCSSIDTMNGHCGCDVTKGLTCQFFPASTTVQTPTSKRGMLPPWIGVNKCAPLLNGDFVWEAVGIPMCIYQHWVRHMTLMNDRNLIHTISLVKEACEIEQRHL
ncbi:hypothetical protein KUTeg_004552 [Tegillarca granosa]|uniref:Uncharacterized protein n=1 Tax=Tegillarca granosa TaxID=220873 RepID=A0ABQ9FQ99_TEGGR|nr:hypothetical protein KUTeg_004552 [Tegillarca granosa]